MDVGSASKEISGGHRSVAIRAACDGAAAQVSTRDDLGEWIEIYNTTAEDIDINGWHLSETNANPHVISSMQPVIVPAGGYRVLTLTCDFETNGGVKPVYCDSRYYKILAGGNGQGGVGCGDGD